jgi:hypothetical protein
MGRGSERTRDELAERAIVFLVDARTARRPVVFDVGTRRSRDGFARRLSVNDADDARQNRLRKRGEEDPATNKSRNASTHSVVSCGREARKNLTRFLQASKHAATRQHRDLNSILTHNTPGRQLMLIASVKFC